MDDFFSIYYNNTIAPKGEQEIELILKNVSLITDEKQKLETIAEWEVNNFTELFWEKTRGDYDIQYLDFPINRYGYDQNGKIRALNSIFGPNRFANNAYWIAYYKMGACGELAYLFENVTNRSGYETRLVGADLRGTFFGIEYIANNHAWVEVKNSDGKWWYFDPDVYGQYHILNNSHFNNRWFDKTENYDIFNQNQVIRVYNLTTREDASDRYPKLVNKKSNELPPIRPNWQPPINIEISQIDRLNRCL